MFSFFLFFIIIFDDAHDGLLRWGWLSWQHLTRPTYQTIGNCATRSNCWLSPNRFQTLVITVGVHRGQRWGVISEAAVKRPHWHRPSAFLRLTKDLLGPLPTIGLPLFVVEIVEKEIVVVGSRSSSIGSSSCPSRPPPLCRPTNSLKRGRRADRQLPDKCSYLKTVAIKNHNWKTRIKKINKEGISPVFFLQKLFLSDPSPTIGYACQ